MRNKEKGSKKASSKSSKIKDPFAHREADKYTNPIPSREYIISLLETVKRPLSIKQLAKQLEINNEEQHEGLTRRLAAMERDGQLMRNRRGSYGLIEKLDLLCGRVIAHPDGYGFLELDQGGKDLFLSPRQMRNVLDGDRVLARIAGVDHRGRQEAIIVDVIERTLQKLVGRLVNEGNIYFLISDNKRITQDIVIAPDELHGAKTGQVVVIELLPQTVIQRQPIGRVLEILGDHMGPGMEIDVAIRAHALPHQWSDAVLQEIDTISTKISEEDIKGRVDLRQLPLVTIDGEDAQDFDDAVYCEVNPRGGYKLIVAIADVSHYVKPNSALDESAVLRGNSVYFPGRVIPMLPEILSNNLCSLKPKVDRLCMACEIVITKTGKVTRYKFYQAVMHSAARLTYTQVADALEGKTPLAQVELMPAIQSLYQLFQVLYKQRLVRGAIDFDFPEPKIIFDKQRKISKIVALNRNDAHRLIEECMLLANVCAAEFLQKSKVPILYRVHLGPGLEKLMDLRAFLNEQSLSLGGGEKPEPKNYADLLEKIADREDFQIIELVLLRSLSQAKYSPDNEGHFGLAYAAYTHFTSPIRRYPDLLVHRAIKYLITKQKKVEYPYSLEAMLQFGEHFSMTERRADDATRDANDWLKCEFMQDKLGEEFDGVIKSTTPFGIFVELKEFFVEGLVHITALGDDYFHYESHRHCLRGERTGKVYRLHDPVKVRLVKVNLEDKKIDFELIETTKKSHQATTKSKNPKAGRGRKRTSTKRKKAQ